MVAAGMGFALLVPVADRRICGRAVMWLVAAPALLWWPLGTWLGPACRQHKGFGRIGDVASGSYSPSVVATGRSSSTQGLGEDP